MNDTCSDMDMMQAKMHLCSHGGDAFGADVATQHVSAQVRILLVFQVGDAAPQPRLILHVSGFKLFVDE